MTLLAFPCGKRRSQTRPSVDKTRKVIPYQPEPVVTRVAYHQSDDGPWITAICRTWENGDEKRCRLCDACCASRGTCLITVGLRVPDGEGSLFSTRGFRVTGPDGTHNENPKLKLAVET